MRILITNDDGISSNGIITLANRFKEMGEVIVVAPAEQMSATSHSLTTGKPLRFHKYYVQNEFFGYAVNGSPTDCVKFGILSILEKKKPDIVVSGINFGRNTGINLLYSGTFAGATEGHLLGIPSFAVSLASHNHDTDCFAAADYTYKIVSEIMLRHDKEKIFLNINVPAISSEQIKGIKITKNSNSYWEDEFEKRIDPFGKPYYWFNGLYVYDANEKEIDDDAVDSDYVSVTPIKFQFTDLIQMEGLRGLEHLKDMKKIDTTDEVVNEILEEPDNDINEVINENNEKETDNNTDEIVNENNEKEKTSEEEKIIKRNLSDI